MIGDSFYMMQFCKSSGATRSPLAPLTWLFVGRPIYLDCLFFYSIRAKLLLFMTFEARSTCLPFGLVLSPPGDASVTLLLRLRVLSMCSVMRALRRRSDGPAFFSSLYLSTLIPAAVFRPVTMLAETSIVAPSGVSSAL